MVDPVEWERRAYGWSLSRLSVRTMSLREYILRSQADLRQRIQEWQPALLIANSARLDDGDPLTLSDVFGTRSTSAAPKHSERLKSFVYDAQKRRPDVDWSLVDQQLSPPAEA